MSGGGGGGKPQPIQASAGERIQAGLAKDQIDYYRGTYQPLEQAMVADANQDRSARFAGQNATAAMREVSPSLQQAALSGTMVDTGALGGAMGQARGAGLAQGVRDQADRRLDALDVGLGATADASKSLSQAAAIQTDEALGQSRLQIAKQNAKNDERAGYLGALGSIGGTYAGYKMPDWKKQLDAARLKKQNAAAAAKSTRMGASQEGYAALSGWKGPTK